MGSGKYYKGGSDFSIYLYNTVEGSEFEMFGMRFKVIKLDADPDGTHSGLPMYSATSDGYLCLGKDNKPKQLRLYKNHHASKDFDWGHEHYNDPSKGGDGKRFKKGVVHVQPFPGSSDIRFSNNARYMNDDEVAAIGKVILHYNPNAKLRP